MNKLLYLSDDEIQSQLAAKYDLLVHIGPETLQYAIIDSVEHETKVLAEFEVPQTVTNAELIKAIEDLPESSKQFRYTFNKVKISFTTTSYTFIPTPLYLESDQQDYGKYLNSGTSGELLVNTISSADIKNVVSIHSDFKAALQRIFQKPRIYSQAVPFLEGIQRSLRREDESVLFIDTQPKHFQIALFKELELEFYNIFEYDNTDEFNYYLLNVIQSLEIQLESTKIMLSGKITEHDEVYSRIGKYFDNIRFIDTTHLVKYSAKFEGVLPHTYSILFSLDLCE